MHTHSWPAPLSRVTVVCVCVCARECVCLSFMAVSEQLKEWDLWRNHGNPFKGSGLIGFKFFNFHLYFVKIPVRVGMNGKV